MQTRAFEAWRRYVSTGALDAKLLRPEVLRAWERSHAAGANPRRARAERLSSLETDRIVERNAELCEAAHPYMQAIVRAAGKRRFTTALSDSHAIALEVVSDEVSRAEGPAARPGSLLSEETAGANAAGSPLAEHGYQRLNGPEHFMAGFHGCVCQGVPLYDGGGAVCGSLSVAVEDAALADRLTPLVLLSSHGIVAEFCTRKLRLSLLRNVTEGPDSTRQLERLHQDLMQVYTAARLKVDLSAAWLSRGTPSALLSEAHAALHRFERLSRVWQWLGGAGADHELVDADELLTGLIDLLQTEASMGQVNLYAARGPSLLVPVSLAKELYRRLFGAIRRAGPGGLVEAQLTDEPAFRWRIVPGDAGIEREELRLSRGRDGATYPGRR